MTRPFVIAAVADTAVALPADLVLEILRPPPLVPVPLAPVSLEGLAQRNGMAMPVIDLARVLGLEPAPRSGTGEDGARVLVVRHGGQPVGLGVARVLGMIDADAHAVDDGAGPDGDGRGGGGPLDPGLLAGLIRRPDAAALPILDSATAIDREFADLACDPAPPLAHAGGARGTAIDGPGRTDDTVRLLCFAVAGQDFALPVNDVREVVPMPATVTPVPRARRHLAGFTTLRGRLLPLVDLAALFGLDAAATAVRRRLVVVGGGGSAVGLVVEEVRDILRIGRDAIDPVPPLMARDADLDDVAGIARADGGSRLFTVLAADRLFRHGAALGAAAGLGEEQAMPEDADARHRTHAGAVEPFIIVRIGGADYGIPVAGVREVLAEPAELAPLPKAPDHVVGVATVRGTVLPVIDPRRLLRLPARAAPTGAPRRVVAVVAGGTTAGLLVDAVVAMVRVPADAIGAAPTVSPTQGRLIRRVARLDGKQLDGRARMLLLLDPAGLLDTDALADAMVAS